MSHLCNDSITISIEEVVLLSVRVIHQLWNLIMNFEVLVEPFGTARYVWLIEIIKVCHLYVEEIMKESVVVE
jgi:hypothetical protein